MMKPPDQIAGYTIIKVLDPNPNFADVFLAQNPADASAIRVVIKWVLRRSTEPEPASIKNEFQIASILKHPNIAKVFALGTFNDRPYMVMEYLEGGDLYSLIEKEGPVPWERALEIIKPICSALDYAHSRSPIGAVVHRDLSPDNIMFDSCGVPKIIDYGIASAKNLPSWPDRTSAGAGKKRYMSLDQINSVQPGQATPGMDIFTVGMVLFEMLTDTLAYGGDEESKENQEMVIREGKLPSVKDLRPDVPEWLDAAIQKAISPDQNSRWPDIKNFINSLEAKDQLDLTLHIKPPQKENDEDSKSDFVLLANTAFDSKDYSESLRFNDIALESNTNDPDIWGLRANTLLQLDREQEALSSIDNAIGLDRSAGGVTSSERAF